MRSSHEEETMCERDTGGVGNGKGKGEERERKEEGGRGRGRDGLGLVGLRTFLSSAQPSLLTGQWASKPNPTRA